ncbi:MAG: PAS domain-containing protein [Oculatellaceae cyanobacterium bins.114]|nr:PAS domain-containing protein [Oculatellaceae cyanobacterium bins.114]
MSQQPCTILIIDDSPEDRELYRRYLLSNKERSYILVEAALGYEGLEKWQQSRPDVVILDYQLPDLNGLEFLSHLQQQIQHSVLPIVVVTGQGNEAIAVKVIKAGAQDYLVKGQITPETLEIAVSGVLETVRLQTQLHQTEAKLRVSEEQLRLALDFGQIGTWDWNPQTNQVIWNENHFRLLGLDPETTEVSYQTWCDRVHPDDLHAVELAIQSALTDQTCYEAHYRVIHPNGDIRWLIGKGQAIYNSSGQPQRMLGVILDVTDRRQTEIALEGSEERFRLGILNAPLPIMLHTEDGEVLQLNQAWVDSTGYTISDIPTLDDWLEKAYGTHKDQVQDKISQVFPLKHPTAMGEYAVTTSMGETRIWDVYASPLGQLLDNRNLVVAMANDITERKKIEADRKQIEIEAYRLNQQLQYLIQTIQQLVAARDIQTILTAVQGTIRRLMATDGATFVLRDGDMCHYVEEDAIAPLWKGQRFPIENCISGWVIQHREPAIVPDICNDPRISSELYQATFIKSLIMVPLGGTQPLGAIGSYWATPYTPTPGEVNLLKSLADATAIAIENVHLYETLEQQVNERTAQLQQLLEFEALLKRITDKVRDSLDEQQILQTVVNELAAGLNLECCDAGIYNPDQTTSTIVYEFTQNFSSVQGQTFAIATASHPDVYIHLMQGQLCQFCNLKPDLIRSDQLLLTILACPIRDNQGVLGDLWLFKPSETRFNEQEVRLVQQVANQCAIALRQSRLYQTAQAQVIELERLNHLKDDFLSTVSHELRAPMANIRMATQMLQLSLFTQSQEVITSVSDPSPQFRVKATQYLQILHQECQRETGLINDLLDLTRLEADTLSLNLAQLTLQTWIPQIVEPFLERTQQAQQHIQVQIPSDLPSLTTDPSCLDRILTELLQNACKYTPPRESIRVVVDEVDPFVKITIHNSGANIPPTECDRIFEKFYRIPNSDPWKHGGTGLGLALVKKLVDLLQGNISVTSEKDWVRFSISLPWQFRELT